MDVYINYAMGVVTTVRKFSMYPYFDAANYVLMCLAVRDDVHLTQQHPHQHLLSPGSHPPTVFSRVHPFSSWIGSMLLCFAGGILGNFLMGEPLLAPVQAWRDVFLATSIWYFINYSPFDFVYKLCLFGPIKLVVSIANEIRRANNVNLGVLFAVRNFPGSNIITVLYGTLKGSASHHMRIFQRLMCGIWQPTGLELIKPTIVTKASSIASIVYLLRRNGYIDVSDPVIFFAIGLFFIVLRVLTFYEIDPFVPFENLFCSILMGGMMDALKRAAEKTTDNGPQASQGNVKDVGKKPKEE